MDGLRRIRDVLEILRRDHPTVTVSKLLFLEHEGLTSPVVDDTGRRWMNPQEVVEALRADVRKQVEEHEPCSVLPLQRRLPRE